MIWTRYVFPPTRLFSLIFRPLSVAHQPCPSKSAYPPDSVPEGTVGLTVWAPPDASHTTQFAVLTMPLPTPVNAAPLAV